MNEPHLEALRREYLTRLPQNLQAIAQGWQQVCCNADRAAARDELTQTLHHLAGSAATFGCKQVADIARRFEALLKQAETVGWEESELFLQQGSRYQQWLNSAATAEQPSEKKAGRCAGGLLEGH